MSLSLSPEAAPGPSGDLGTEVRWRFDHFQRVFPLFPSSSLEPGGHEERSLPFCHQLVGERSLKRIISTFRRHRRTFSPKFTCRLELSVIPEFRGGSQRERPRCHGGAGSTVTGMLFNTGIPLVGSGINALSSQSVLFAWGGGGRGQWTGATEDEGLAADYRSVDRNF